MWAFFNKVSGSQNSNFIKKRLQHKFFNAKFEKFLRPPRFTYYLQRLLLPVSGFQPATLLKRRLRQKCFSMNFAKLLRTSFDRTPPDDCFLCLSENFEKFFRTPLLQSTSRKLLISCTSCRISTTRYSKKLFHNCFSIILYKNNKQSFEDVKILKDP